MKNFIDFTFRDKFKIMNSDLLRIQSDGISAHKISHEPSNDTKI